MQYGYWGAADSAPELKGPAWLHPDSVSKHWSSRFPESFKQQYTIRLLLSFYLWSKIKVQEPAWLNSVLSKVWSVNHQQQHHLKLEMQIIRPHAGPTQSESLKVQIDVLTGLPNASDVCSV
jgi:hypothetical protein